MGDILTRQRVKDEAEAKILRILEDRCEGAIGKPFGMTASQVAEEFDDASTQLIAQALKQMPQVSSYKSGEKTKFILKEYDQPYS